MDTVYNLFKFLHIVSTIVWVGGVITVGILDALVAREKNQAVLAAMARQSRYHGMSPRSLCLWRSGRPSSAVLAMN